MGLVVALSSEFHSRLGEKAASELAGWLNAMDADVRNSMQESMHREFALFRAEIRAEMSVKFAEVEAKFDKRFSEFESRLTWKMVIFWIGTVLSIAAMNTMVLLNTQK